MRITLNDLDAVVLAGGINRIPLYEGYTPGYKALLPFAGKPAIQYTLEALANIPGLRRTCIVGPKEHLAPVIGENQNYDFEPGGETLVGSVIAGLRHFRQSSLVLIATSDLPLITTQALFDFLNACAAAETDYAENLFLSVVPDRCATGPYQQFTKGFNRFRDVAVCHANVFLAQPSLLDNQLAMARVDALYSARKSPVKSAMAIGLRVGLSYVVGVHLLHALTLAQMARIASWRFGVGLIPVIVEHPEITVDVDEPADYEFVKRQLE